MHALLPQMDVNIVRSFVFTLLHTLWQAAAIVAVLSLLLRLIAAGRTGLRYALCSLGLVAVLFAAGMTWAVLDRKPVPLAAGDPAVISASPVAAPTDSPEPASPARAPRSNPTAATVPAIPSDWTTALGIVWATGVVAMLARLAVSVAGVRRIRNRARPLQSGPDLDLIAAVTQRIGLHRAVRILTTRSIQSPAVLGILRPVLLLPAAMLSGLPAAHLQAIIAHELAHIRRWDYLVNLGQMLIEALLFFNPAVWWISRQMRIEREACCDAIAVAATGQPIGYAEALAGWAQRLADLAPLPAVAPAFADRHSGGILLERVRRILRPGDRPAMRLSWPALVVVLITGALLLTAMWRGTGLAVALAAEILTPEQRMQQIQQAADKFAAPQIQTSDDPAQRVSLSGTLVSMDGRPLPPRGNMIIRSETSGSTTSAGERWQDGRFDTRARPGMVWIVAEADGFAPATFGPLTGEPGAVFEDIELMFPTGVPAEVHVKDDAGQPVSDTEISLSVNIKGGGYVHAYRTDDMGVLHIPHASDAGYNLSINARGIQKGEARGVMLKEGEPYVWTVQRSKPTTLTFTGTDGTPVADALVRIFVEQTGQSRNVHMENGPTIGRTDADGRIDVDTLADGATYILLLHARDGRRQLVREVRAGDPERTVQLDPEISVTGTITGDLSRLEKVRGKPVIQHHQNYKVGDHSSHGGMVERVEVEIRDGVGYFTLRHLLPMELRISAGNVGKSLNLDRSVLDLVIHLAAPEPIPVAAEKRTVEIVLKAPPDHPAPAGTIHLSTYHRPTSRSTLDVLKLVDGRVRHEVLVGASVNWKPDQLLGYWIPERRFTDEAFVTAGEGPQVIEIDAYPAGAIVGRVYDVDGKPIDDGVIIGLYSAEKPPLPEGIHFAGSKSVHPINGRFMLSPAPFGGHYVAGTSRDYCYVFTEPVLIDAANPTREVELRLVKGVDAAVIVQDADGQPLADLPVKFWYDSPYSRHGVSPEPVTDADGRVVFKNLNPNVFGRGYSVHYETSRTYIPASVPLNLDGTPAILRLQRGGSVTGKVVAAKTGWPIPGVSVYAAPVDWKETEEIYAYEAEENTDNEGRFRFSNLPPQREYSFRARAGSRSGDDPRATPDGGTEVTIAVELPQQTSLQPVPPK